MELVGIVALGTVFILVLIGAEVLFRRRSESWAKERVGEVPLPSERILVDARCNKRDERKAFWPLRANSRGTLYVTDRRILWKTDFALLPTQFEEIDPREVSEVTVAKFVKLGEVRLEMNGVNQIRFAPFRRGHYAFPLGEGTANDIAEAIENHPLRRTGVGV
jgi:hypothetical protein